MASKEVSISKLYSMFHRNKEEIAHKAIHYFPIYERYFSPFINKSFVMFEIGVYKGGSLKLWRDYCGPFAIIIGIDIDPRCKALENEQSKVRIAGI